MRRRKLLVAGAVALAAPRLARAATNVRFVLDFALQGNHSVFAMGIDRGHYGAAGLNVAMDRAMARATRS